MTQSPTLVAQGIGDSFGVAIDSMGNIYAADYYNQKVWRVKSEGDGSLEVFATLPDRVAHVALDDEADCAYITTPDALWKVAGLHDTVDSTQKKLVASIPGAIGVTLDTARRFGYVTANGALLRVALDGQPGTNTTEVARIETDEIGDVALDGNRENAYVTDVKGGSLFKINLEKETSIKVGENLGNPMGVTLDDLGNAYVTSGKEILWRVSPGNVQPVQIASIPVTPPATICSTAGVTWNDAHDRVCVTDRSGYLWQVDQVSSRVF